MKSIYFPELFLVFCQRSHEVDTFERSFPLFLSVELGSKYTKLPHQEITGQARLIRTWLIRSST